MCLPYILFPTDATDCLGQRQHQVAIGNYFKHLYLITSSFLILHSTLICASVLCRQAAPTYDNFQLMPSYLDELRDVVGREGGAFSSRVLHYFNYYCRV